MVKVKSSTSITIRIDDALKKAAQNKADSLGISLSQVIKNELRRFVHRGNISINQASTFAAPRRSALSRGKH
jgi:antitoxin component of RelBE/YafQ-DinJ toxin-antitoxin module